MVFNSPRYSRRVRAFLVALVLALGFLLALVGWQRFAATPKARPISGAAAVETQGVKLLADADEEPATAQRAFGFDLRGAGLLPVRLALEHNGERPVRIDPQQTFLIDRQGLAWPLLTAGQASERLAAALPPGEADARRRSAGEWLEAAPRLTPFALDVFVRESGKGQEDAAGWRGWLGRLMGGEWATPENRSRRDLVDRFLSNPSVPPGTSAEAFFFFPGRPDETRGAGALRLALDRDGRVQLVTIPFAPAR